MVFNGVPSTENSIVIKAEKVHDLTSTCKNDKQNETNVKVMTDTLEIVPMVNGNPNGAL